MRYMLFVVWKLLTRRFRGDNKQHIFLFAAD